MALDGKLRKPGEGGGGSGCSRQPAITPTRSQEKSTDTTSMNRSSRRPSKMQGSRLASRSQPVRTPCAILLQPTYWRTATTQDGSRVARAYRCSDPYDLHPCLEPWGQGC